MARFRVVVVDHKLNQYQPVHDYRYDTYRYVLWADAPAQRQGVYANPNARSEWKGASAADHAAIQNGSVVEVVREKNVPAGTKLATLQAAIQNEWQAHQDNVSTYGGPDGGSTWDGTTWVVQAGA